MARRILNVSKGNTIVRLVILYYHKHAGISGLYFPQDVIMRETIENIINLK